MNERFDFTHEGKNYQGIVNIEKTFNTPNSYRAKIVRYKFTSLDKANISTPLTKWQIETYLENEAHKPMV